MLKVIANHRDRYDYDDDDDRHIFSIKHLNFSFIVFERNNNNFVSINGPVDHRFRVKINLIEMTKQTISAVEKNLIYLIQM